MPAQDDRDQSRVDMVPFWNLDDTITPVELPPLPPITPTSPNCVVTVAVGDRGRTMLDVSRPSIKAYAEKCGADYHEITDDKPLIPLYPMWDKFRSEQYFDHYDRMIFVDADIIVRDTAPNLFDLVPRTHVAKHDDLKLMTNGFSWYYKEVEELIWSQGLPMPTVPKWMLNSGLYVASKEHREAFKPLKKPFRAVHCAEQHHISIMLTLMNVPIWDMPRELHWMWWNDKELKHYHQGQFIHMAGLTDHKKRIRLMEITAKQVKKLVVQIQPKTVLSKTEVEPTRVKKKCGCGQKGINRQK